MVDNLNSSRDRNSARRTSRLERVSSAGRTAVTEGAFRVLSNEGLKVVGSAVVSGWLIVTGTLKLVGALVVEGVTTISGALSITGPDTRVTGPFHVSGDTDISGNVEITGPSTTVTGPFHVTGDTDIRGNLEIHGPSTRVIGPLHVEGDQDNTGALWIRGITSLSNDLRILFGGKVTAGDLTITPSGELSSPSNIVVTSPRLALSAALRVADEITNPGIPNTTSAANMFVNAVGQFQRIGSASRLKIDAEPMELSPDLLDVTFKHWIDKGNAERFAALYRSPRPFTEADQAAYDGVDLHRVPGVIAEEVRDAGGESFVSYDESGEVQGVAYDRLALARTQILADQVRATAELLTTALARIDALERAAA